MFKYQVITIIWLIGSLCHPQIVVGQSEPFAGEMTSVRKAVAPFSDTLFYINANIGSFSIDERAASITDKIKTVSKLPDFRQDAIKVIVEGSTVEIVYENIVIMGVTDAEAHTQGKEQIVLAHEYAKKIGDAITEHKRLNDWHYILIRVALILGIILAQYLLIRLINKFFLKVSTRVAGLKGNKIKSLKIKSINLIDAERTTKLILSCITMLRYLIAAIILFLTIPLMFSVFPPTRGIADKLFGYVLNPLEGVVKGVISYIPNLITIIVIVFIFRYLIRALRYFATEIEKGRITIKGFYPDWAHPSFSIIKTVLYAFMLVVIFPYLPKSDSDVFKGVSVFIGVIISLGSSSFIANAVSGLVLTYMRSFNVGDRIKIGELIGNVVEKTPFVTRIRTAKNEEVTMPNSSIMSAQTFNYTHSAEMYGLILHTEVSFGYDVPWKQVHQLLLEAAARTADVEKEPKPFVLQTALDDFYAVYQINVYIRNADKMNVIYSDLNQHIQDVFNEAGLELVAPHYAAHRDGSHTTLPPEYLPAGYRAAPFNVKVTKHTE